MTLEPRGSISGAVVELRERLGRVGLGIDKGGCCLRSGHADLDLGRGLGLALGVRSLMRVVELFEAV